MVGGTMTWCLGGPYYILVVGHNWFLTTLKFYFLSVSCYILKEYKICEVLMVQVCVRCEIKWITADATF